jgi:excinuclease ABC subunit C
MKQRVSESLLDDCPGVSENRKKLLLRHFGSIEKLRHATAEEICAVEGIGPKLAGTLVDFFAKLKRRGARSGDENAGDETEAGVVTYRLKPQL